MRFASKIRSFADSAVAFGREVVRQLAPVIAVAKIFVLQVVLPLLADMVVAFIADLFASKNVATRTTS